MVFEGCETAPPDAEHSVLPAPMTIPENASSSGAGDVPPNPRFSGPPGCARRGVEFTEQTQIAGVNAATFNAALEGGYAFVISWKELDQVTEIPFQLVVNPQGHSVRAGTGKPGCHDLVYVDFALDGELLAGRIIDEDRGYAVLAGEVLASTFVEASVVPDAAIPGDLRDPEVTEFRVMFGIRTGKLLELADEGGAPFVVGIGKGSVRFTYAKGNEGEKKELTNSYATVAEVSVLRY